MIDRNPKYKSEMLLASQLKPFFNDLGNEYQGKTVYLYPESYLEPTTGDADLVTLVGCTVAHQHRKNILTFHTREKGKCSTLLNWCIVQSSRNRCLICRLTL